MEKKNNFFPLLLIGGGIAGATLLYLKGTKQTKESLDMLSSVGVGGSGDFLGSSGVSKGYDSTDLGIEDFAFNRASPDAFALPSDGAANPVYVYDDSGEWSFADVAFAGLTAAGIASTAAKGAKTVASKVGQKLGTTAAKTAAKSTASTAAKSAASTAAKSAASTAASTAGKVAGTAVKVGGALGVLGIVDTFFEMTGVKDAHFSGGLTGNLQGVNTSLSVKTDEATKESVGNMVTSRQKAHAVGLSGGKYPITKATPEEAALVNKAVGLSSGDVLKVTGGKFTSYIPEKGMQVSYSTGGTLQGAVNTILANKARKEG